MSSSWHLAALLLAACSSDGTTWLGAQIAEGSGVGSGGDVNDAGVPADFFQRYEAESPNNTLTYPVEQIVSDTTCPVDGVVEGADCSSAGKRISYLLGRSPCDPPTSETSTAACQNKGGGVRFNAVSVPVDGSYDVTWWYHCGGTDVQANVFGDANCGGLDYGTGAGTGCRPQLIDVNDIAVSKDVAGQPALYFQFPCYTGSWSVLHGATTSLSLRAGVNAIYIHAPPAMQLDAADVDALDVQAPGHGRAPPPLWPQLIGPVLVAD